MPWRHVVRSFKPYNAIRHNSKARPCFRHCTKTDKSGYQPSCRLHSPRSLLAIVGKCQLTGLSPQKVWYLAWRLQPRQLQRWCLSREGFYALRTRRWVHYRHATLDSRHRWLAWGQKNRWPGGPLPWVSTCFTVLLERVYKDSEFRTHTGSKPWTAEMSRAQALLCLSNGKLFSDPQQDPKSRPLT